MDWFTEYHDYAATQAWFKSAAESRPDVMSFHPSIGRTAEGRDIFAVRIGNFSVPAKRTVYIQAYASCRAVPPVPCRRRLFVRRLVHAREWIATASIGYVAYLLSQSFARDGSITDLLNRVEFYIVPIGN